MAQEVKLGGERLGSGSEMTQEMHNYGMNSFNVSQDFKSTMAPGILYPCFKQIGTNFGTFDIDLDTFVRTLPTKGPLFGSFKMQIDVFNVPFRLYQGVLHNNPVDIGMDMHQVYLPAIEMGTIDGKTAPRVKGSTDDDCQVSTSALVKYLGLSGIGHHSNWGNQNKVISRKIQCVPMLGYYDIFKNYYSNKQETNAYVITPGTPTKQQITLKSFRVWHGPYQGTEIREFIMWKTAEEDWIFEIETENNTEAKLSEMININLLCGPSEGDNTLTIDEFKEENELTIVEEEKNKIKFSINKTQLESIIENYGEAEDTNVSVSVTQIDEEIENPKYTADIELTPFALKNIDKMRSKLLANNEIGQQVLIKDDVEDESSWGTDSGEDTTGLPYIAMVKKTTENITWNAFTQNALVVKTYQSDLFNNWLDSSYTDKIAQRTKIDTTSGGFTPDTLILQEKIYNLLNRIIVGGGTYYDWQEATYGEGVARMCEIPMYIGGMSTEIMFEEVVNNSANDAGGNYQALGSLGGKGMNNGKKGGNNIHVRMDEPGYIIAIASITPRISQYQGNDWDLTEIKTMDDLHKPELDGIGFQDLMAEQMCWWNTVLNTDTGEVLHRDAVGKQTAWINWQTAVDKVYGDFAKPDGYSFMVLSRGYEHSENSVFGIKDMTTYIDPAKYNYAFAYQDLAAQNFWVQIAIKCTARRKMGAQQLPML